MPMPVSVYAQADGVQGGPGGVEQSEFGEEDPFDSLEEAGEEPAPAAEEARDAAVEAKAPDAPQKETPTEQKAVGSAIDEEAKETSSDAVPEKASDPGAEPTEEDMNEIEELDAGLEEDMGGGAGGMAPMAPASAEQFKDQNTSPTGVADEEVEEFEENQVQLAPDAGTEPAKGLSYKRQANRKLAADRLQRNAGNIKRELTYFQMLDLLNVEPEVEFTLIQTIRAAVENDKLKVHTMPIRGIDLDEFVANLSAILQKGGSLRDWASGKYALKYNDLEIPTTTVRDILSSNYLYQPRVKLQTVESERKRSFRDKNGKQYTYYLKVYATKVEIDLSVWVIDIEKQTITQQRIPTVNYRAKAQQLVKRTADGEFNLIYSPEEVKQRSIYLAATAANLKRKIRRAISGIRDLKMQGDLVETNHIWGFLNVDQTQGVRPDDYFQLMDVDQNGEMRTRGWARIYDAGDGKAKKESLAFMVSSPLKWIQGGELGYQYPLVGVSVMPKVGLNLVSFDGINAPDDFGTIDGFSNPLAYGFETRVNIGRITGLPISDWWFGGDVMFAPVNTEANVDREIFQTYWGLEIGKRYWLGRLGLMPTLGLVVHHLKMDAQVNQGPTTDFGCVQDFSGELVCAYKGSKTGIRLGARWEIFVHPRVSLGGNIRYQGLGTYNQIIRSFVPKEFGNVNKVSYPLITNPYSPGGLQTDFGLLVTF